MVDFAAFFGSNGPTSHQTRPWWSSTNRSDTLKLTRGVEKAWASWENSIMYTYVHLFVYIYICIFIHIHNIDIWESWTMTTYDSDGMITVSMSWTGWESLEMGSFNETTRGWGLGVYFQARMRIGTTHFMDLMVRWTENWWEINTAWITEG